MKKALVTGANQGIGSGFVEYLLENNWKVFATTRKETKDVYQHANLTWLPLELTSDKSITHLVEVVTQTVDSLDLLVNNAGINKDTATGNQKEKVGTFGYLDRTMLLEMFNVNAVAPLLLTEKLLPLLTTSPSFVVNISSCRASFHDEFENDFGNYGYRASKVALNMFTFCSVKDLSQNVQTYAVHPGTVQSQMNPGGSDTPYNAAKQILAIRDNWDESMNGRFFRYSGELYPL